ncbi:MAG: G8 domain-containing protein [Luteolibacter sp.]
MIRAVHVAGTLAFSRDADTLLCTGLIRLAAGEECKEEGFECHAPSPDYTVEGERPALEVGTPEAPIPAAHKAVIRLTYIPGMDPDVVSRHHVLRGAHGFPRRALRTTLG